MISVGDLLYVNRLVLGLVEAERSTTRAHVLAWAEERSLLERIRLEAAVAGLDTSELDGRLSGEQAQFAEDLIAAWGEHARADEAASHEPGKLGESNGWVFLSAGLTELIGLSVGSTRLGWS
jgi:hypothetical protein